MRQRTNRALSIPKHKATLYQEFRLEELVHHYGLNEQVYDKSQLNGTHTGVYRKQFYINKHSEPSDRDAVRSHMRILSVISAHLQPPITKPIRTFVSRAKNHQLISLVTFPIPLVLSTTLWKQSITKRPTHYPVILPRTSDEMKVFHMKMDPSARAQHHNNPCPGRHFSTSPLPDPICHMQFNSYVFTCMILEETHLNAMKRVLCYLRGTTNLGLQLFRSTTSHIIAYSDADWQNTLSHSSAEAEYRMVANVVAETSWIRNLLRELHTPLFTATLVYCDNVSAVYMSANPVQHQRTKHIEIDIHFVRDKVAAGHVRVLHVPSRFQYADIFTKGLPYPLFADFRSSLSVRKSPAPTAGAY
ncbi:ribonuclease H-like domain-containing protein [Tanacetum coccineum]